MPKLALITLISTTYATGAGSAVLALACMLLVVVCAIFSVAVVFGVLGACMQCARDEAHGEGA